ncbi:MAG TPA: DUF3617 family protein [Thermoanaerobaculia bacterium]|nr:DUF3617 family protein [Thermoanaerobaculia bacterium]
MRKSLPYVLAALAAMTIASSAFAAHPQKPGKWRVTMEMDMPGMPMKMPPITHEVCVTEEDMKDPQKSVPNDPKSQCKVSDYKVDGNTVSWTVECPKQDTKGEGHITFDGDSYTGAMKLKMGDREMTQKYSGKWLGACEK